jgi:hypothetical protein
MSWSHEFAETLGTELDYRREADNVETLVHPPVPALWDAATEHTR